MAFSFGRPDISLEELHSQISEPVIAARYLNIKEIPCLINSPLRKDNKPSFGIYTFDGVKVGYTDFATGERGSLFDLLSKLWNISFKEVLEKIAAELLYHKDFSIKSKINKGGFNKIIVKEKLPSKIEIKIRDWKPHDIKYWKSYGITLDWLKYAGVCPISHKFIIKGDKRYIFGADKYAYAFIEKKEGKTSIKIYQPFNKNGFKWCTSTDSSVISLWTKVPKEGEKICICSSLKDALCLWSNTGIPALSTQGEGYKMSNTAINELKRRFKSIYILFDCDEAGIIDGEKLSKQTGFINIVLPKFKGGKDVSDLYHYLQDKNKFKEIILNLFN